MLTNGPEDSHGRSTVKSRQRTGLANAGSRPGGWPQIRGIPRKTVRLLLGVVRPPRYVPFMRPAPGPNPGTSLDLRSFEDEKFNRARGACWIQVPRRPVQDEVPREPYSQYCDLTQYQ